METIEQKTAKLVDEAYEARIKELEAENKQLKGEEPIPLSWWKDCPKLAQRTIERIIYSNRLLEHENKQLKDAIEDAVLRMDEEPAKEVLRQALKPKQEEDLPTFEQMTGIMAEKPEQENGNN